MSDNARRPSKSITRRRTAGVPFNLLIAGHASTGKTLFLQTLYEAIDVKKLHFTDPSQTGDSPFLQTDVQTATPLPARIEFQDNESQMRFLLRLIDSPGLPIPVNIHKQPNADYSKLATLWSDDILKYIETQYELTLLEESKVKRNPKSPDYQTHCLLYFLDPNVVIANKGLTPIDRLTLKRLTTRVNVIPIIAKADLLSKKQVTQCKKFVMDDIINSQLDIFGFVNDHEDEDDDDDQKELNKELKASLPLTVINSEIMDDGRVGISYQVTDEETGDTSEEVILGRDYPWGIVQTENPTHCDFTRLKQILFLLHQEELKNLTREMYYEQWRTEKLMEVRGSVMGSQRSLDPSLRSQSLSPGGTLERSLDRVDMVKRRNPGQVKAEE